MKKVVPWLTAVIVVACCALLVWRAQTSASLPAKYSAHAVTWRRRTIRVPDDFAVSVRNDRLGITRVAMTQPDTLTGIGPTTLMWSGDRTPGRDSSFVAWQDLCTRTPGRCIATVAGDHGDGISCLAQKGPVHVGVRCRRSDKGFELEYVGDVEGVESFRVLAARIFASL